MIKIRQGRERKKFKKVSSLLLLTMAFHFGSQVLKQQKFPFSPEIYHFIVKYVYQGIPGIVLQPFCEWFWGLKYYPLLYFLTGVPALCLWIGILFITRDRKVIIQMKEEKKEYRSWRSGGNYRENVTSIFWKVSEFIQRKFLSPAGETDMDEEASKMAVCRVICGNQERIEDMAQLKVWEVADILKIYYDSETRDISLIFRDINRVLKSGQSYAAEEDGIYITYL